MIDLIPFITFLQNLPNEILLLGMYGFAVCSLLLLHHFLGKTGIYVYMALGVIVGNIQVLKAMTLTGFSHPVAMGTIVFMTTFLATDILAERYGKEAARKAIWCGFSGIIFTTGMMILTLGMPSLTPSDQNAFFNEAHYAMQTLFLPAPALFIASLTSYLVSQYVDVHLFLMIKRVTEGRLLWLRSFLSTATSSLLDNILFSVLAWKILAPLDIDTSTLIFTYILGTYTLRLLATGLNAPIMYLIKLNQERKSYATA
tara:strand:+ start:6131 stop:6901 length:771 start_codon:yes stop_codon:yes gene_type:complete